MDTSSVNPQPAMQPDRESTYAFRMGKEHLFFVSPEAFAKFPDVTCFEVICEDDRIVLIPPSKKLPTADQVRAKIAGLGITEEDVAAEVAAVRAKKM